jgi:hypothetical protein
MEKPVVLEHWHLKKEVSLATMIGLLANMLLLVAFTVRMDNRIEWLEKQQATDARIAVIETEARQAAVSIGDLERRTAVALDEIKGSLRRIEDRLVENGRPRS